jgi:multisubunit Na+/H+ antiporter MnhF subunit
MTGLLAPEAALLLGLLPCGWIIWKQPAIDGLVAFELASTLTAAALLLMCEAFSQPAMADLALALVIMSFGGGLVYARFLERWV